MFLVTSLQLPPLFRVTCTLPSSVPTQMIPAVTGDWRHVGGGVLGLTWGHSPVRVDYPADLPRPETRIVNMSRLAEALTVLQD